MNEQLSKITSLNSFDSAAYVGHPVDDAHIRIRGLNYTYVTYKKPDVKWYELHKGWFDVRTENQALYDVNLDVERGKITAVIGASGSGKSTFAVALTGVHALERDGKNYYSGDMIVRSASINEDGNRIVPHLSEDGQRIYHDVNINRLATSPSRSSEKVGNVRLNGDVFATIRQKSEHAPHSIEEAVDHGKRSMDGGYLGRELFSARGHLYGHGYGFQLNSSSTLASGAQLAAKVSLASRGNGKKTHVPVYTEEFDAAVARLATKPFQLLRYHYYKNTRYAEQFPAPQGPWISHEKDARVSYRVKGTLSKLFGFAGFAKPEQPDFTMLRKRDKDDAYAEFKAKRLERLKTDKESRAENTKDPWRIPEDRRQDVMDKLDAVNLGGIFEEGDPDDIEHVKRDPHDGVRHLSGGQQQRVSVAAALNVDSEILIADEATSSVGPNDKSAIGETINALRGKKTIFWICHDMQEVARLSDRIVVMHKGRVAIEGPTREVFFNPEKYIRSDLPQDDENFSRDRILRTFNSYIGDLKGKPEHENSLISFDYVFRDSPDGYDGKHKAMASDGITEQTPAAE